MQGAPFDRLLARPRVVLTCLCARPAWWPASAPEWRYCHRFLVAGLLVERGAVDGGELVAAPRAAKVVRGLFDPPSAFLEGGPVRGRGTR